MSIKSLGLLYLVLSLHVTASETPFLAFKKINILGLANYSNRPRGPGSVARSLIEGLKALNIPFEIGVCAGRQLMDVVLVQGGEGGALETALKLKREGRIKKLIVGPNFYPDGANYPEVDVHIVPSRWVITYCQEVAPELVSRCRVWPSGVDVNYWAPVGTEYLTSKKVLVYWKTEGDDFCSLVGSMLKKYGWEPIILRYGTYSQPQYKEILTQCRFAVFISRSESQGLALAECWAMDIPTLPWNPGQTDVRGKIVNYSHSCPYINQQLGADWKTIPEFKNLLSSINTILSSVSPRAWVMKNMSDQASVLKLVSIINESFNS